MIYSLEGLLIKGLFPGLTSGFSQRDGFYPDLDFNDVGTLKHEIQKNK
jgi:hypothetical protein